jgi:hypothetical protein
MMIRTFLLACICASAFAASAEALPINLVTNGSFETGDLTGWTVTGGGTYPVSVIITNGVTGSAFGEAIPSDPLTVGSPDAGGNYAAYFVDDSAHQTLSQSVFLTPGNYEVGFDIYDPQNGYNNPNDASFSGAIAGITLADITVHSTAVDTWLHFSGDATVLSPGDYSVAFNFVPDGPPAADVIVDRVYIDTTDVPGTPIGVPEPVTLSIFGAGLAGVAALRRRRKKFLAS